MKQSNSTETHTIKQLKQKSKCKSRKFIKRHSIPIAKLEKEGGARLKKEKSVRRLGGELLGCWECLGTRSIGVFIFFLAIVVGRKRKETLKCVCNRIWLHWRNWIVTWKLIIIMGHFGSHNSKRLCRSDYIDRIKSDN